MDEVYQTISKAINIDSARETYTKLYDFVRKAVVDGLKENEQFKALFCELSLCGSYADNLKVSKPDEFDLVMRLKFPYNELVKIHPDPKNRGNNFIELTKVLEKLLTDNNFTMLKFLQGMVDEKKYFLQDKFQQWLEGCVTKFFTKIDRQLIFGKNKCSLKYRKQGPAHTMDVSCDKLDFSIDFVPGFRFEANKSISKRKMKTLYWEAIPKPINGTRNNPSFRASFTESERTFLNEKNQLKNVLRIMKKFRDMRPKLTNLKSYYIKTLFLWQSERMESAYWRKPISEIVNDMFMILENALKTQQIKYFWDENLNLLSALKPTQIESMFCEVKNARQTLVSPKSSKDILDLFLTGEEQRQFLPAKQEPVTKKESIKIKKENAVSFCLGAMVGAFLYGFIYAIYNIFKEANKTYA